MKIFHYDTPAQKPYALYIHGLGSSAASGTKSSLARSMDGYRFYRESNLKKIPRERD